MHEERISCLACGSLDSLNICPRCALSYCSVKCYRNEQHRECSESFYRECVEQELRLRGNAPKPPKTFEEFMNEQVVGDFPIDMEIPGISVFFLFFKNNQSYLKRKSIEIKKKMFLCNDLLCKLEIIWIIDIIMEV